MTCCTSEIRYVIPAEAGIQNAVPALIEKLPSDRLTIAITNIFLYKKEVLTS